MRVSLAGRTRRAVAVAALFALSACARGVLDPAGPVQRAQNKLLFDAMTIMLTIVVPVIIMAFAFAWWFRSGNARAKRRPDFAYSGQLELVIWAAPLLTIMFLGGLIWISSHELDPYKRLPGKPVEIEVVSLDWKWLFIYPQEQVASVNELVVPAGQPVHFRLTSASVMNAFFVPQLGSMIYTMAGMADELNLQADKPGVYAGRSTHYSGDGFSSMHFDVHAVPAGAYAAWLAKVRAGGPALTEASYRQLAQQSQDVRPFTYRAAAPGLFEAVVSERIPVAPGPSTAAPHQSVHPVPKG